MVPAFPSAPGTQTISITICHHSTTERQTYWYVREHHRASRNMTVRELMQRLLLLRVVLEWRTAQTTEEVRTRVMVGPTARTKANVVYFLQTHARPAQIARLVQVITEGSPN